MTDRPNILVSACLLGEPVRYDGTANTAESDLLKTWQRQGRVVPFCPEVAGQLGTPRPPAEIVDGTGADVLDGDARVETESGDDVTDAFLAGAHAALEAAQAANTPVAILKARSPSCGSRSIYDGTFSRNRRSGRGVTAALLERNGIRVFNEDRLDEARAYLDTLTKS